MPARQSLTLHTDRSSESNTTHTTATNDNARTAAKHNQDGMRSMEHRHRGRHTGEQGAPQRDTVAGDACNRSCTSKMRLMRPAIWMISPLFRHSFLLSSRTVFMLSIQTASTGPSNTIHFLDGLVSVAQPLQQPGISTDVCACATACAKVGSVGTTRRRQAEQAPEDSGEDTVLPLV